MQSLTLCVYQSLFSEMQYGSVDYWDNRYQSDTEPFEWYNNYVGIRHFLSPKYLCRPAIADTKPVAETNADVDSPCVDVDATKPPGDISKSPFHSTQDCRVLILGCGNSQVGEQMLSDGFRAGAITQVDFSSIVVDQMKKKYTSDWYDKLYLRLRRERKIADDGASTMKSPSRPKPPSNRTIHKQKGRRQPPLEKMIFECQDLTKKVKLPDDSFDLIICKGTLDAVLCNANTTEKVNCMLNECHRVLDSRGVMMIVSYGEPETRLQMFDNNRWEIKHYAISKPYVPGEKLGE